jgi:hypothetical protein
LQIYGGADLADEDWRYADHTSQLSEETQRDAAMDVYIDVKKAYQNTSFTV